MNRRILIMILILVGVMGCDTHESSPPALSDSVTQSPLSSSAISALTMTDKQWFAVENIQTIMVQFRWTGIGGRSEYIGIAPVESTYYLTNTIDGFIGQAYFLASPENADVLTDTISFILEEDKVSKFLSRLSEIPLENDRYTPFNGWTDDYPSYKITVKTKSGTISFYSESQGTYHTPWGMTFQNTDFTIDGPEPFYAFNYIFNIHSDRWWKMIEESYSKIVMK